MKVALSFVLAAVCFVSDVIAHGHHERSMHPREIAKRQLEANDRHVIARNCAPEIAAYHESRKLARRAALEKRAYSATTSALQPHETTIKNFTCVTAPEVTEGPYYLNNDLVRQDLRENQKGILLELDVGVIDTSTCQPLPSVLVELWHCNATGYYSGFTGGTSSGGGSGGGGGSPGGSGSKTDSLTFLRGGWETNSNGIVTFNTIYPGYYTGRTIHIHTMVHQNIQYNSNGTYTSHSGTLLHIGQMFFDEALNNQVVATSPYSTTTQQRTYNTGDSILAQENSNGYSGYVDASLIGSDVSQGVLGFITLGVNSKASYSISSNNYYTGGDPYVSVAPDSTTGAASGPASSSSRSSSSSSSRASSSSSRTSSTSSRSSTTSSASSAGQTLYGQCGGQTWTGPTTCASGTCTYSNPWYSQCLP